MINIQYQGTYQMITGEIAFNPVLMFEVEYRPEWDEAFLQEDLVYIPIANTHPVVISLSNYIPAGGQTNTTARLTAPGGKTFQAGRISDDVNNFGLDLLNNRYTEFEICIMAANIAQNNDIYEFRIVQTGRELNNYVNVPQWTIGFPPSEKPPYNPYYQRAPVLAQ